MNYLKIDNEVEKLNLQWYEYDFGDTLYAKIPTSLLSQQTNITDNCETEKYRIQFDNDGYITIFKESEQASSIEKRIKTFLRIYSLFKRETSFDNSQQQTANQTVADADLP